MRVAAPAADGAAIANQYPLTYSLAEDVPVEPWAMPLTNLAQQYVFVFFDFDAKAGNAVRDAQRLSHWLDVLNIEHLVTSSGPSNGRHVWLALDSPADASDVADLGRLAQQLLPSLDKAPLSNPVAGAARPPHSPHRHGGASVPLVGRIDSMSRQAVTPEQLELLRSHLIESGAETAPPPLSWPRGVTSTAGHPHLKRTRGSLSARVQDMLATAPDGDASSHQFAVLTGMARAGWQYSDALPLLTDAAGLEHSRTTPSPAGRTALPADRARKRLADDWRRAVLYVAANPLTHTGDDSDFTARAAACVAAVTAADELAQAVPGIWGDDNVNRASRSKRGRPSYRAILRALCLYIVTSARLDIEVDIRRLSADTGYGRTSAANALTWLSTPTTDDPESAWIVRTSEAEGEHGARYRLSSRFSTEQQVLKWSQAAMRPRRPAPDLRNLWISHLTQLLHAARHDTFAAPHSLGRQAGRIYAHLSPDSILTTQDLANQGGTDVGRASDLLNRLASVNLARRVDGGWVEGSASTDAAAAALGVAGYLEHRRVRYRVERHTWAWWQAEQQWMCRRGKKRRARRPAHRVALFPQNDRPDYPRYPRGPSGRGDHSSARELVKAGALESIAETRFLAA